MTAKTTMMQLGKTRFSLNSKEFDDGIDCGISAFYEEEYGGCYDGIVPTQQLLKNLVETLNMTDIDDATGLMVPQEWKIGYVIGKIIGMLNPGSDEEDEENVQPTLMPGTQPFIQEITKQYQQVYGKVEVAG